MNAGSLPEWIAIGVTVLLTILGGVGKIIKQLYDLGAAFNAHKEAVGTHLTSIATELLETKSDLKADIKEIKMSGDRRHEDHEARLRELERKR